MFNIEDVMATFSDKAVNWNNKKYFIANQTGISSRLVKMLSEFISLGMSVLDIGSGVGKIVNKLKELDSELDITALDISYEMILQVKQNSKLCDVNLLLSDAQNMCFRDHSFDLITVQQALHHIPNSKAVLHEINRVLKPNGVALILTVGDHYQGDIFHYDNGKIADDLLGRVSVDEIYELVEAVGLKVFTIINDFFSMLFKNFNSYYEFMNAIGSVNKIFNYKNGKMSESAQKNLFFEHIKQVKSITYDQPFSINGHYITIVAKKLPESPTYDQI